MKHILFSLATVAAFTLTAAEDKTIKLVFDNNNNFENAGSNGVVRSWSYNGYSKSFNGGGTFTSHAAGYKGKCVQLKNGKGQRVYIYSAKAAPVMIGKDTVKISAWTKGKGSLQMLVYGYDAKDKISYIWSGKNQVINAPAWKECTWSIALDMRGKKTSRIRLAFLASENSDFLLDELKVVIERANAPAAAKK